MVALSATDLHRFFHADDDEIFALRGVSLRVDAGELVAISGPSGSGKSTLLHCLAGIDEPDAGTVMIAGERLTRRSEATRAALRARHIGLMFQTDNLIDHLDVAGNVRFARLLCGHPGGEQVSAVLDAAGITHRSASRPSALSGGELARAGLAVALANDPDVILADEPTGELDADNTARLLTVLRQSVERGAAAVIVTHDPAVTAHCDRHLTIVDGRLEP